jgi:acetylornithine deacetylase/succinyl-diaminopimelate desuccinylase-like protein
MGTDAVPAEFVGERRYAEHVAERLRRIGLDTALVGTGDRISVVAEARGRDATETVLIASHLDTVPVEAMEIDPFDPRIEAGRLYGRGSCDTKSGMASALAAIESLTERGGLRRNVILVGEADEEAKSIGVDDVLAHLGTRKPDWALATEPTGLGLVTHHKGVGRADLRATGIACHSSDPGLGRNAIVDISRAVLALEHLGARLARTSDPRLGPGTLSVGLIGGGQAANIVPPDAWLHLDRRLLPGEDLVTMRAEIEEALARADLDNVRITNISIEKPALGTAADSASVRACSKALAAIGRAASPGIAAFGTDAGLFSARGIDSVVFGPGQIAQAHTAAEFVEVAQVEAATKFFEHLLGSAD